MKLRCFLSASIAVVCAAATLLAGNTPTVVHSLRADQTVQTREIISIWSGRGTPILAVRSMEKNSLWWIQRDATPDGAGKFSVLAQFGNDKTPSGTRFEVAVLLATDGDAGLKAGESMKKLPASLTRGQTIEVAVDRNTIRSEYPVSTAFELTAPTPGAVVERRLRVSVETQVPSEGLPMLLVRSSERNSPWWVQDAMQKSENGDVTGLARIGNDKSSSGSRFELILAMPKDAGRKPIEPGSQLKDLSEFHCSSPIAVTLGDSK